MSDLVAKLNEHAFIAATETQHDLCAEAVARIRQLEAELTDARRSNEALRDALTPFGAAADDLYPYHADIGNIWESPAAMGIAAGDLRKARATLAAIDAALAAEQEDRT